MATSLLAEQMAVTGQHHDLAVAGDRRDDMARLGRQQLVAVAVEQQQRTAVECAGHLATGRLRGEGDHADDRHRHHHRAPHGHRATEAVPHHDDALGSGIASHLHPAGQIVGAQVEIVRLPIPDPHEADTPGGPSLSESVVQRMTRAEHAAQRTSTRDDGSAARRAGGGLVGEHREQAASGVDLPVPERRRHLHLGRGQRMERFERRRIPRIHGLLRCVDVVHGSLPYKRTCRGQPAEPVRSTSGTGPTANMPAG